MIKRFTICFMLTDAMPPNPDLRNVSMEELLNEARLRVSK